MLMIYRIFSASILDKGGKRCKFLRWNDGLLMICSTIPG